MTIEFLSHSSEDWHNFLKKNHHLVIHTPKYKQFIEETFGLESYYIADIEDEILLTEAKSAYTKKKIKALLPLFEVNNKIFGNRMISSPYLEYGGFAGSEESTSGILDFMKAKFKDMDFIEIRQGLKKGVVEMKKKLESVAAYKRFVLKLTDKEKIWKGIQKSKRKAIHKSAKTCAVKRLNKRFVNQIWDVYARNMKEFGSPPFPKLYFTNFFKHNLGECFGAFVEDKLAAILLGFTESERIHVVINVSSKKYAQHRPNDAVYWAYICWGLENGFKEFDFGRVREGSGHYSYKKKWGAEESDLFHYYLLLKDKKLPKLDKDDFSLASKVWRRLPLSLTKAIGPSIRKGTGL